MAEDMSWDARRKRLDDDLADGKLSQDLHYQEMRKLEEAEARDKATVACENVVRNALKAPATADFSGTSATGGGSSFRVTGSVDAENSFGAQIRSRFECQVTGGRATLVSLE